MRSIAQAAFAIAAFLLAPILPAQSAKEAPVWQLQSSGTTAGLRGIDSVDGNIAWASGSGGTVLRTTDGGQHWIRCATPDADPHAKGDGATLDFRGVQAWDASTAIVMASGPGAKSRLYKTTDACKSWKLVFENPHKDGFWDAMYFDRGRWGWLLGDPVKGMFTLFSSGDGGRHWIRQTNKGLRVTAGMQGAFAASNSSLLAPLGSTIFVSGGSGGAFAYRVTQVETCLDDCPESEMNLDGKGNLWSRGRIPLGSNSEASGAFSIGFRDSHRPYTEVLFRGGGGTDLPNWDLVAVGGDFTKPNVSSGTAAYSTDGGAHWTASTTPPHGFRSAVQWSAALHAWITVGTNGSDISRDDGRTWRPLDNGNWNALSLPFVVGPNGRIAKLNPVAIPRR